MYITNINWDSTETNLPKEIDLPKKWMSMRYRNIWHLKLGGAAIVLL